MASHSGWKEGEQHEDQKFSCEFLPTSIPVHPCSWQNMESLVLLEIAYPACSKMKIIPSLDQETVPGICKLPSDNVSREVERCPPEHQYSINHYN